MSATGYAGLLLLMAAESACLPLPSEVILPFAGYLVSKGQMNLWLVATVGALGCNLGSLAAYELGRWGGREAVLRWGRYVMLIETDLVHADRFFARFGSLAVLIGRMLPVVRSFIALPAGIARMNRTRFHIYTFIGSWPWCLGLAWIGEQLGEKWQDNATMGSVFHYADFVVGGLLVVFAARFWWKRRGARSRPS